MLKYDVCLYSYESLVNIFYMLNYGYFTIR